MYIDYLIVDNKHEVRTKNKTEAKRDKKKSHDYKCPLSVSSIDKFLGS